MLLKMQVVGNLGRDCKIQEFNGKKVLNFSVAHTEKYKNADGVVVQKTTWVECSMWEKNNLAPYLKAGQLVHLEGTPDTNAYLSKENKPISTLRLKVSNLILLGGKKEEGSTTPAPPKATVIDATGEKNLTGAETDDDLPF